MKKIEKVIIVQVITALFVLSFFTATFASWNLSADIDARAGYSTEENGFAELHAAGLLLRKTFADKYGDRMVFSLLAEANNSFKELMLHELYLKYKGPMGRWNITAGRLGLPYGLLPGYSTNRLIFETLYEELFGFDVDNGALFSGVVGSFDYGVAVTQGRGAHHQFEPAGAGLVTARGGITLGSGGDYAFGVSAVAGSLVAEMHDESMHSKIVGGAVDATLYSGALIVRGSLDAGKKSDDTYIMGYSFAEYRLGRYFDVNSGVRVEKVLHKPLSAQVFAGFSAQTKYVTVRGGYCYVHENRKDHKISFQLYRIFTYSF